MYIDYIFKDLAKNLKKSLNLTFKKNFEVSKTLNKMMLLRSPMS